MPMIEPELALFQSAGRKSYGPHATELGQAAFGIAPKALNAVNVNRFRAPPLVVPTGDREMLMRDASIAGGYEIRSAR